MKNLPAQYDHKAREKHWQEQWVSAGTYCFRDDRPREQTFVIDTPPPTVSGVLHMGHIFSYTQADFVARFQRMSGKDVFYPMGFDDNGLPTERLVEKTLNIKGSAMPREAFVTACREVVKDAEDEFRKLFKSAALSVDWTKEYQTISDDVRKLSQASFVDLLQKGEAYRDFRPTYWDWVDQTAIAQAEIENKELPGVMNEIEFVILSDSEGSHAVDGDSSAVPQNDKIIIMTTRPELLGACVAVMYHPEDPNATKYAGKYAVTPLFGVKVPMIADEAVERDKGTGLVMCCTFGDDTDKEWVRTHQLPWRPILTRIGKLVSGHYAINNQIVTIHFLNQGAKDGKHDTSALTKSNCHDLQKTFSIFQQIDLLKPKQANAKIIELLQAEGKLLKQTPMTHTVKCAERSGTPIEIIPTHQWFVKVVDKKEALLEKGAECVWHPEYMRIRLNQWIEGLKEDWCISRQRFFGVPFPVWYAQKKLGTGVWITPVIFPKLEELPIDPLTQVPKEFKIIEKESGENVFGKNRHFFRCELLEDYINPISQEKIFKRGDIVQLTPDHDVMDTWATSSISPQINAKGWGLGIGDSGLDKENASYSNPQSLIPNPKLFPADLRPQAHEIIRTWAFYTIVKAYLHNKDNPDPKQQIPWKNLMISGWCLAADKSKMSKSKGNIITPVALIEEKGSDAVRYWASTSRLGTDTAFSEDLLKIGRKLVTKLWNASNFASLNLSKITGAPTTANADAKSGIIGETLDLWILSRLNQCIKKATKEFEQFEYCDARVAIEDFFWNDFCDNYLELVKARAYDENASGQQSALYTIYHCLETLLRLFAPFIPHITEDLYSHIFDDRYAKSGSVHARGMWPLAEDYPYESVAELSGMAAVDVLNVIRKAKSEANVSIKFPVKQVEVLIIKTDGFSKISWEHLKPLLADLRAAGNADSIAEVTGADLRYVSEKGWFSIDVILEKTEEQKRNPDQSEHHKLEGKIIHGPGNPDMSKHIVKVQVNSLPETLQKQK